MAWIRLAWPGALTLCALSACGGSAFTSGPDTSGGTAGASAGDASSGGSTAMGGVTASGGAASTGGTKATGGRNASGGAKATGGFTAAGGAKASGGATASGGTTATGGTVARGGSLGSGGSGNTSGGGFDGCTASSQCTLVAASCCGPCEPSKLSDYVAINSSRSSDYFAGRACTDVLCAPCLAPTPELTQSGNYGARCVSGHCQAFDVRNTELSACQSVADCTLRFGVSCCEGCGGGLTAVNNEADLQQALCGDPSGPGGPVACPACAPIYPSNAKPSCGANGRCAVTWAVAGTN